MDKHAAMVVRDDGVAGSNPATPSPDCTGNRTGTGEFQPVFARFWSKVTVPEQGDKCWLWRGAVSKNGYGSFRLNRQATSAHRVAYWLGKGAWPPAGQLVRHKCDNPLCVNPEHLESGTHLDNSNDKIARGRASSGDTSGERNGRARLTAENVAAIREMLARGRTNTSIGKAFGVHHATISVIRRGKSWSKP